MQTRMIEDEDVAVSILLKELLQHRGERRVKEADQVKAILLDKHSVRVYYRRDGTIGWSKVTHDISDTMVVKRVVWSMVPAVALGHDTHLHFGTESLPLSESSSCDIPLVIATVNTPSYRSRLVETMEHLSSRTLSSNDDNTIFAPIHTIDLLDLSHHPSVGTNRILFEGWRQILLPMLLSSSEYAEDDVRLSNVSPGIIDEVCSRVLDVHPDLHILSLGHAYAIKSNTSLLECLSRRKGLHATTLLALRHPEGIRLLLDCMDAVPRRKRCHLDQFLFHSTLHNVGLALSDPPLVGWGEVAETLSSVGSGCRRNGGGRLEQIPVTVPHDEIRWVRRNNTDN